MQFVVSTVYYLTIALIAAGFSWIAYGKKNGVSEYVFKISKNIRITCYIISAMTIALPLIFTDKGIDRETYISLFQNVTWEQVLDVQNQEPGFMLINLILKTCFGTNHYITLIFFYSLMTFNVYFVIYKKRNMISVPFAVFIFSTIYTIQSINLMRIAVAGSILVLAAYMIEEKHIGKSILLYLFAITIHYSSILYGLVYVIYFIYGIFKDKYVTKTNVIVGIMAVLFILFILVAPLLKDLPIIDRYDKYLENIKFENLGFLQPTLYVPLILLSFYMVYCFGESREEELYMSHIIACFFLGMVGYMITIIGRSYYLFMYAYVIRLPYIMNQLGARYKMCYNNTSLLKKEEKLIYNQSIRLLLMLYILFQFIIYMMTHIELDGIGIL